VVTNVLEEHMTSIFKAEVLHKTTQHHNPEDHYQHLHHCENHRFQTYDTASEFLTIHFELEYKETQLMCRDVWGPRCNFGALYEGNTLSTQ
jgi:hypothetical protein